MLTIMSTLLLSGPVRALKEDRKRHGPLDGHAVKVYGILLEMDLPEDTLADCRGIAKRSQDNWRAWFKTNRAKVEQYQGKIDKLKADNNRATLKTVQAEKKEFMHTAPSLLRGPEPLKETLSEVQYASLLVKLKKLKKELHKPKAPSPATRTK